MNTSSDCLVMTFQVSFYLYVLLFPLIMMSLLVVRSLNYVRALARDISYFNTYNANHEGISTETCSLKPWRQSETTLAQLTRFLTLRPLLPCEQF